MRGILDRYGEKESRFWWPCTVRRVFAVTRLLGLRVRVLSLALMSVCCECCVLSGRGQRPLRQATNHSSRGVLLSVECLSVIVNPRQ